MKNSVNYQGHKYWPISTPKLWCMITATTSYENIKV